MEKRSSKEYLVVFYTERQKVQVTKFAFEDFIIEDITLVVKNNILLTCYARS